jgi:hypothetical protein
VSAVFSKMAVVKKERKKERYTAVFAKVLLFIEL